MKPMSGNPWKPHEGHFVRQTPYAQLLAVEVHSEGGATYMPLVRLPFVVDGVTDDDGDLWLPGNSDDPAPAQKACDDWHEEHLGTEEKVVEFLRQHGLLEEE